MKLADHLTKEQKQQLNKVQSPKKPAKRIAESRLSQRELEDLMGTRRDTYVRRNGAMRRK